MTGRARRISFLVVGALIIAGAAAIVMAPFWTVQKIRAAAEAHDVAAFSEFVDFPAVRESLRQMEADFLARMLLHSPGATVAKVTASSNEAIELAWMPPEQLVMKMNGNWPPAYNSRRKPAPPSRIEADMGYERMNRFAVSIQRRYFPPDSPSSTGMRFTFILTRDRLVFWKITGLRMERQF